MKYTLFSRILHWLMAIIIISDLALGVYMTKFLDEEAPNLMAIYGVHKSLGVLALTLIFIRIANRVIYKSPAFPESLSKIERTVAYITHTVLYFLMIAVPLSGYLMSNSFGYSVHFFGIEMPNIYEKNFDQAKIFANAHKFLSYVLIGAVILHILGALKHCFFDSAENNVLKRMV